MCVCSVYKAKRRWPYNKQTLVGTLSRLQLKEAHPGTCLEIAGALSDEQRATLSAAVDTAATYLNRVVIGDTVTD